ncbi:MAG: Fe-Mn family superoxide dismutase [Defluviitaleaceae bacterium]|nr:Fe-Mn family superoxide dismutase [Defluviitaleaceae bacterium]
MDYGTDSAAYIKKFMDSINWDVIEERMRALPIENV